MLRKFPNVLSIVVCLSGVTFCGCCLSQDSRLLMAAGLTAEDGEKVYEAAMLLAEKGLLQKALMQLSIDERARVLSIVNKRMNMYLLTAELQGKNPLKLAPEAKGPFYLYALTPTDEEAFRRGVYWTMWSEAYHRLYPDRLVPASCTHYFDPLPELEGDYRSIFAETAIKSRRLRAVAIEELAKIAPADSMEVIKEVLKDIYARRTEWASEVGFFLHHAAKLALSDIDEELLKYVIYHPDRHIRNAGLDFLALSHAKNHYRLALLAIDSEYHFQQEAAYALCSSHRYSAEALNLAIDSVNAGRVADKYVLSYLQQYIKQFVSDYNALNIHKKSMLATAYGEWYYCKETIELSEKASFEDILRKAKACLQTHQPDERK